MQIWFGSFDADELDPYDGGLDAVNPDAVDDDRQFYASVENSAGVEFYAYDAVPPTGAPRWRRVDPAEMDTLWVWLYVCCGYRSTRNALPGDFLRAMGVGPANPYAPRYARRALDVARRALYAAR